IDSVGQTALHIALAQGHKTCVTILVDEKRTPEADLFRKWQMLHLVVISSKMDFLHEAMSGLVDQKIKQDPVAKLCGGRTPLHRATEKESIENVEYLLDCGFPADLQDLKGCTAIHIAPERLSVPLIEIFLKHGASFSARDDRGQTVL
ncbi:ankyrin, partial [Tothia fuscella]